ncbi:hypothetical protein HJC23_003409 [Cyclotella cryptica]|uniref:STAS domain-containing protein n=1 Tax=Cyclotella cryptica TaxID=29204 RepID=A0ABD3QSG8_9STRA
MMCVSSPANPDNGDSSTANNPHENVETNNHSNPYPEAERDPFFAFIPKIAKFGGKIVCRELATAQRAVVGFPSWSKRYVSGTFSFYKKNPRTLYDEIISGFTVAIMQVPESIAFSFVAGVPPLSGLHATFWMATITGLLGGKPGMISGAAGALAVVVADLTIDDGVLSYLSVDERLNVLYFTMVMCGVAQILFAWLRLAMLVRLIPETGMIGFMNGLAIIIFMAQLPAFQTCDAEPLFVECSLDQRQWLTFQNEPGTLSLTLVHVFSCMAIMKFFPKVPKIGKIIPASLMGLLIGTLIEHTLFRRVFGISTRTVAETAPMSGNAPMFSWPTIPTDSNTISVVVTYALTLAAIGGVESVLTLQACNEITDTVPKLSDSNQELFAQGLANLVSGMFHAMGGDAMIGQSTINIMNGARHRVSSTMSGIFMLLFVVALSGFIELLPVSTLTGVLFMVVLSTFQWKTFNILRYGRLSDSGVIVLVTLVAVFFNLAVAIAAGIVFSALVHAWDSGTHVDADIFEKPMLVKREGHVFKDAAGAKHADDAGDEELVVVKYVHVKGSIFFGSARHFINMFSVSDDPQTVVIDFKDALIIDHSAVAAIGGITHRYAKVGKRVLLINLPHKSHGRLHRTGDHTILAKQIILHEDELVDVEEGSKTPKSNDNADAASGIQKENKEEGDEGHTIYNGDGGITDEHATLKGLQDLQMFQAGVDSLDHEIDHLEAVQGTFTVHEINEKKDS